MDFFCFRYFLVINLAILTYYKQIIFPVSPMDFCLGEFLPRRLLPQKDPLDKNECPGNVSPYLAKSACGLARVLIYQTLTTWAICLQKM